MRITFTGGTLVAGIAALTMFVISAGPANSQPKDDPIAWITQYENDAAAADFTGDVSFYQKNLTDDWSDGMSNGQFQTKKELISDLTDKAPQHYFSRDVSEHEGSSVWRHCRC